LHLVLYSEQRRFGFLDFRTMGRYPGPRSPARVMNVLEALAEAGAMSLTRLSEKVQMPKTSLLSMLRALETAGYVVHSDADYRLGPLAFRLGLIVADKLTMGGVLRPLLEQLAKQSKETVLLAMLDRDRGEALYIDVLRSESDVILFASPGTRRPLYCTAIGRAMLAFQDEAFVQQHLSGDLPPLTRKTVTSPASLRRILNKTRTSGYAEVLGEFDPMSAGTAAPIFNRAGKVDHAISIAAPLERLRPKLPGFSKMLLPAAEYASRIVGFSGVYPARAE